MTWDVTARNRQSGWELSYQVTASSIYDAVRVAADSHPEVRVIRVVLHA